MSSLRLLLFAVGAVFALSCGDGRIQKKKDPVPIPETRCGDGRVDEGEACDLSNLDDQSCTSLGFDLGTLSCDASCQLVTSQCVKLCGDGKLGPGEECDGDQGPLSCGSWGYKACSADTCKVDAIHCRPEAFISGTPLQLSPGGPSLITDLAPEGYGDLVTAVPDRLRLETHAYDSTKGFIPGRKLSRSTDDQRPVRAIAGDLDGDGHGDLAAINEDGTADRYRYVPPTASEPTEHFAVENLFAGPAGQDGGTGCRLEQWVGAGELDGSPGTDLVALGCDGGTGAISYGSVFIFSGGQVPGAVRQLNYPRLVATALADLDGDGALDVLAVDKSMSLVVFAGPSLEAGTPVDLGLPVDLIAAADLDGDGDADLVVDSGGSVVVLDNLGNGFVERQTFPGAAFELLVRDLDLDGKPDVTWLEDGKVQVRRNLGQFVFSAFNLATGAGTPLSLAAGDVEGDGDPDLAVSLRPSTSSLDTTTLLFLNQVR